MAEKKLLTAEGYQKLVDELEDLKVYKRKEVAQRIAEARAQGDLSENAEYDAAKDEQSHIEGRIDELEELLKNVEIAGEEKNSKKINLGSKVLVHDEEYNEDVEFVLVGSTEADSLNGKISNESPVGAALIGHKKNDVVLVETPGGVITYKVLKVEKA